MAALEPLAIFLNERRVGAITPLGGDRQIFAFDEAWLDDPLRPVLSLSFKDQFGGVLADQKPTQTRLSPFFSNLLPEGPLRDYLAQRAGVHREREFHLLRALGRDLPGAVIAQGADAPPPTDEPPPSDGAGSPEPAGPMRFSLAGVQLKFSAIQQATGGLTIPADGGGGSWIVKLPSAHFPGVAENEQAMMTLARQVGIDTPDHRLLPIAEVAGLPPLAAGLEGHAYAVRRFDRTADGRRIHMEDFAQIFGVYPQDKYKRASYRNIATVIWRETGEAGAVEFVRRLVFNALIGNADMHLKNWSLIYPGGVRAALAPAYDLVSTVAYIPDPEAALTFSATRRWDGLTAEEIADMAAKAGVPVRLARRTAGETVAAFREIWARERAHLPLNAAIIAAVEQQLATVPLARL